MSSTMPRCSAIASIAPQCEDAFLTSSHGAHHGSQEWLGRGPRELAAFSRSETTSSHLSSPAVFVVVAPYPVVFVVAPVVVAVAAVPSPYLILLAPGPV